MEGPRNPLLDLKDLCIHLNLMTLRQRREIYNLCVPQENLTFIVKLLSGVKKAISVCSELDSLIDQEKDYLYRAEFEEATLAAERAYDERKEQEEMVRQMDADAARQFMENTLATSESLRYKRGRSGDWKSAFVPGVGWVSSAQGEPYPAIMGPNIARDARASEFYVDQ